MAQADQTIQNATFPNVRADINDNLAALFSQSSGPSAPAVTVAHQPWIDTSASPAVWKIRNGTNTGWITVGTLDTISGNFAAGGVTPIASGGTGQTTASAAINALVPAQAGNADKYLKTDGSIVSWAIAAAGASLQVFTSSTTYTPTTNRTTFLVIATGGGAGGGGGGVGGYAGGGGGGGGTAMRLYTSTEMGANAGITIGAAGTGGAVGSAGGAGGSTSLDPAGTGVTLTANGGTGGVGAGVSSSSNGGAGGTTTNGVVSLTGNFGAIVSYSLRQTLTSSSTSGGGSGGATFWGLNYGSGGNGGFGGNSGTAGTAGVVVILEW